VWQRSFQIALILQNQSDVVGADGDIGVVGAIDLLIDGKRALRVPQRFFQIALIPQYQSDVVGIYGDIGVVGAMDLLIDGERALRVPQRSFQIALIFQNLSDVVNELSGNPETGPRSCVPLHLQACAFPAQNRSLGGSPRPE